LGEMGLGEMGLGEMGGHHISSQDCFHCQAAKDRF